MLLAVKIRFQFLLKYFPQHKALCSYFTAIVEISQTVRLQLSPKPTSSGLKVEAKFYFQD